VKRRGIALPSTAFACFTIMLFGMMLAALASTHYHGVRRMFDRRQAFEAAQAGLARATWMLGKNPQLGDERRDT
jgi:hypothetical protein